MRPVCGSYACSFCAFSKGSSDEALRGRSYELSDTEVARRTAEAWARGATEVCMQGGIHPSYDGHSYLGFLQVGAAVGARWSLRDDDWHSSVITVWIA